jgi:NADH dehydrogenase (ubiquinone) 1 beta subcomplex subunit 3
MDAKGKEMKIPHQRDPWARFEAWRYSPEINKRANIKRMFPGLGLGFGAFLVLCAWEELYYKPRHPEEYSTHHH